MNYQTLLNLAEQIAYYLPNGWRVDRRPTGKDPLHDRVRLINEHHLSLRLYEKSYQSQGKVTLYGECPDFGLNWREYQQASLPRTSPSINVSPTRPPRAIAADIERRLLPAYRKMVREAEETACKYKNNIALASQIEHAIRQILPSLQAANGNSYATTRRYWVFFGDENNHCRSTDIATSLYGEPSCDITLHDLSIDKAIQILALLNPEKP